jgi:hypothetical protein
MSLEKKLGNRRSLGFKIATTATALLMGAMSYTGCRAEPVEYKPVEEVVETVETEVEEEQETFDEYFKRVFRVKEDDEIFPDHWDENICAYKVEDLSINKIERSENIFYNILSEHPLKTLKEEVIGLYVLDYFELNGIEHVATQTSGRIYIVNKGYTDSYFKRAWNHEYFTLLLMKYNDIFDEEVWRSLNPDLEYLPGEGPQAIKEGKDSLVLDSSLFEKGGLHEYSLSSLFNHTASFSEYMFSDNEEFWQAIKNYDILKQELKIIEDFYIKINEDYAPIFEQQHKKHDVEL